MPGVKAVRFHGHRTWSEKKPVRIRVETPTNAMNKLRQVQSSERCRGAHGGLLLLPNSIAGLQ